MTVVVGVFSVARLSKGVLELVLGVRVRGRKAGFKLGVLRGESFGVVFCGSGAEVEGKFGEDFIEDEGLRCGVVD